MRKVKWHSPKHLCCHYLQLKSSGLQKCHTLSIASFHQPSQKPKKCIVSPHHPYAYNGAQIQMTFIKIHLQSLTSSQWFT